MVPVTQEVATQIGTITTAYNESKTAAEESITSQIGLFDELSGKSELSTEQMAKNLDSQTKTFLQYKDDLLAAEQLVEDGLMDEGLLGSLKSLGIDGAGYLNALVDSSKNSKDEFEEMMDSWSKNTKAKDTLTNTLADMETNYNGTMSSIISSTTDSTSKIQSTTKKGLELLGNVFLTSIPEIGRASGLISQTSLSTFDENFGIIDGKSTKMRTIGKNITDSLADGIEDGTTRVSAAIARMVQKSVDSVDVSGIVDSIDQKLGERLQ